MIFRIRNSRKHKRRHYKKLRNANRCWSCHLTLANPSCTDCVATWRTWAELARHPSPSVRRRNAVDWYPWQQDFQSAVFGPVSVAGRRHRRCPITPANSDWATSDATDWICRPVSNELDSLRCKLTRTFAWHCTAASPYVVLERHERVKTEIQL